MTNNTQPITLTDDTCRRLERIIRDDLEHASRETVAFRSCDAETTSGDGICPACADAMREERATEQAEQCRTDLLS